MATIFDVSLLEQFSPIFVVLLVYVVIYGFLEVGNIFKNRGLHAIIALSIAVMFFFSKNMVAVVTSMTPFFVIMIVFLFFLWMIGMFLGFTQEDLISTFGGSTAAFWWILVFAVIILSFAFSQTFGQTLLGEEGAADTNNGEKGGDFGSNLQNTIFHPKILGLVLILLIASFAIRFLSVGPPIMGE